MAEHFGTVNVTVEFQFGPGETACLDVCETIVNEHYLLGPPSRDDAAGVLTSVFSLDVAVDPADGEHGSYRVVRE